MNRPLLVFSTFSLRDELFRCIHHTQNFNEPSHFLNDGLRVDAYSYEDAPHRDETNLFSCTIRVRTKTDFLNELDCLKRMFPVIFVYHDSIDAQELALIGSNLAHCPEVGDLERVCGLQLSDEQRQAYTSLRNDGGNTLVRRVPLLEEIFDPRAPWNREEDTQLTLALERSLADEEQRKQSLSKKRVQLQEGWRNVLRKSEAKVSHQPVCVVCLDSRASICLVECGHQVMCDECVEIMWTRADVNHCCPVCKQECTIITRPIWSEVEPPQKKKAKKRA